MTGSQTLAFKHKQYSQPSLATAGLFVFKLHDAHIS